MQLLFSFTTLILSLFHFGKTDIKTARADKKASSISYTMKHTLHEWTGTNKAVEGVIQYDDKTHQVIKVAILAKVSGFDSENSNRDSHMLEVTEGIKYPNISFVSTSITDKGNTIDVKGQLSFHGVMKEISFTVNQQEQNNHKVIRGFFPILIEDFKIERPSLMMIAVENEVKIEFTMDFPL